ncbi:MAG: hypothetical protein K8R36_07120 [Planctomycetales bacterium]|nr:hypothetical protein [Planctomycetales bacterium]
MGWYAKGKSQHKYFYRSIRIGDRVKKVCLGRGFRAIAESEMIEERKKARSEATAAQRQDEERIKEADSLLREFTERVEIFVTTTLLLAGWHNHKGEWRRRR